MNSYSLNFCVSILKHSSLRKMSFKVLSSNTDLKNQTCELMTMKSKIIHNTLEQLHKVIRAGGGAKAINRHTVINKKLLVRERLKLLLDANSPFLEIGILAGMAMDYGNIPAAGVVAGIGKIQGRYCIVAANDATVKGGTFFPITVVKQQRIQGLSYLNKLPCIYLVDSGGAFLPLQADIFPDKDHGGRSFYNEAVLSSLKIPQIAVVCGNSTAGGAYCPSMAEEAIIVKGSGIIFLGGPPLVKAATGETVTEQELGGAIMHCSVSGCTDYFAESEEEAIEMCRESILTLNTLVSEESTSFQKPLYPVEDLLMISAKNYLTKSDMYDILSRILDGSMFKEFKGKFGHNLITGFGYIKNILVGIVANCNTLSFQDSQKGAHFIQLCEKRNIPLCFLQNSGNPEEAIINDDQFAFLRNRAKMVYAHSCSKVPKITLCVGGCYEDDNFTMCGWDFNPNFFLSWPLVHISSSRNDIQKIKTEETSALKKCFESNSFESSDVLFDDTTSVFYKSSRMLCDAVISPEETREVLSVCLKIVSKTV